MSQGPIVGIDLGTTFSAVARVRKGLPEILPKGAERIIPSVVGFTPEGTLVVGTAARNQYVLYPESTVRSIKRRMGDPAPVQLHRRDYQPAEISAMILREMKAIAEQNCGGPVDRAVITVPAFFSDAARQATRDAGEIAGFTVERIVNEPTAAALAYGLDRSGDEQLVAVYDLGGGTFDVSIVEFNQGILEVRASHGNTHLGGDDFDDLLVTLLAGHFEKQHGVDPRGDRKARARLERAAEQAKIELSTRPFARVREEYLLVHGEQPFHLDTEIRRDDFEELIQPLLESTLTTFDQALRDAGLQASDLDKVLFVGGSTRIPLLWRMVAEHTGREPMMKVDPDEAVALGAAIQAALIQGEPLDTILVDVSAHSLGIEVAEWSFGDLVPDHYGIVLRRNTPLPARHAEVFSAVHPGQTAVNLKVYQGESPVASQNTLLGEFLFEGMEPEAPGRPPHVTVEFDLDLNGILRVSATDRGGKKVRQTTLRAAHHRLSPAAREASALYISELWEEAQAEDPEGTEGADAGGETVEAADASAADQALLTKAQSLIENGHKEAGAPRKLVSGIHAAHRSGDSSNPERLNQELLDLLYEIE